LSPITPAIKLDRVSRLYGSFAALRELTFSIPTGSTILLLGENGAGKSTLLRLLAGLASPSFGEVRIFAERPLDVRERIAFMSHSPMLYDELTARENLTYFAALYAGFTKLIPVDDALQSVGLKPTNPRPVGQYSQGMRQRVALARTLMTSPDLLLLDEPFSNLDVDSVARMTTHLQTFLAEPGVGGIARTLILTTHQRDLAQPLNPVSLLLREGRIA
jgi:heme ABC exporter ATP-binding subunit CcmA